MVQLQHIFSPHGHQRNQGRHEPLGLPQRSRRGAQRDTDHHRDWALPTWVRGNALDIEVGTTWNYLDNLSIMRGRHTWKFGVEIRRIWLNNSAHARPLNVLTYTSDANFMNNVVDSISVQGALPVGGMRRTFWMGFAQDEIKLRPNLT